MDLSNCAVCGTEFEYKSKNQKYCADKCNRKAYVLRHPERAAKAREKWANKNKKHIRQKANEWYSNNKEHMAEYRKSRADINREYWKTRRAEDPVFRLKGNLRNRLNALIKGTKSESTLELLGCSEEVFIEYIESQFDDKMNWDNYGEWQLDHIEPLAKYNLENNKELKEVCHYTNLQPLWEADHHIKTAEDNRKYRGK